MPETFNLPRPISTNHLFKNVRRGRKPTDEYLAWKHEASLMLMTQRARPIEPPYRVVLMIPSKWRGDLDNAAKAPLDALQSACVLRNDRDVMDLRIVRGETGGNIIANVETIIAEVEPC